MIRFLSIIAIGLATLPTAALAQLDSIDQWKITPGVTMRGLVDNGYEVRGLAIDNTTFETNQVKYFMYTLQKGTDVAECSERVEYVERDKFLLAQRYDVVCYTLVEPYVIGEESPFVESTPAP